MHERLLVSQRKRRKKRGGNKGKKKDIYKRGKIFAGKRVSRPRIDRLLTPTEADFAGKQPSPPVGFFSPFFFFEGISLFFFVSLLFLDGMSSHGTRQDKAESEAVGKRAQLKR